jgi:hypothetical protein
MPTNDQTDNDEIEDVAVYGGKANGLVTFRSAQVEASEKTARFILATGAEVRYNPLWQSGGDVIRVREFRLARYRQNPVVLLEHDQRTVIGRGTASIVDAGDDGHQLQGAVEWDIHESNPLAVLTAGQHARGMRHAVSVGMMPGRGSVNRTELPEGDPYRLDPKKVQSWRAGMYYREPELWEFRSVSIPKDPGALQLRAWADEAEAEDQRVARVVDEILTRKAAALVLEAYRADASLRTAIVASVLAEIPAGVNNNHLPAPKPEDDDWEDWR